MIPTLAFVFIYIYIYIQGAIFGRNSTMSFLLSCPNRAFSGDPSGWELGGKKGGSAGRIENIQYSRPLLARSRALSDSTSDLRHQDIQPSHPIASRAAHSARVFTHSLALSPYWPFAPFAIPSAGTIDPFLQLLLLACTRPANRFKARHMPPCLRPATCGKLLLRSTSPLSGRLQ
jgi:hypothetical protein